MSTVYEPGTSVRIGQDGKIIAHVLEVRLISGGVRYKVSWWNDGSRHTALVDSSEVSGAGGYGSTAGTSDRTTVGFSASDNEQSQ